MERSIVKGDSPLSKSKVNVSPDKIASYYGPNAGNCVLPPFVVDVLGNPVGQTAVTQLFHSRHPRYF